MRERADRWRASVSICPKQRHALPARNNCPPRSPLSLPTWLNGHGDRFIQDYPGCDLITFRSLRSPPRSATRFKRGCSCTSSTCATRVIHCRLATQLLSYMAQASIIKPTLSSKRAQGTSKVEVVLPRLTQLPIPHSLPSLRAYSPLIPSRPSFSAHTSSACHQGTARAYASAPAVGFAALLSPSWSGAPGADAASAGNDARTRA